jgi:hypothetical protein
MKKTLNSFSKKNINFLSQVKNSVNKHNKYKIKPTILFKENCSNKNSPNILKINIIPEKLKIPIEVGVIKENFISKYLNKTNLHRQKIFNIKKNIINKINKTNDGLPLIHSSRAKSKTLIKPTSAIFQKKIHSSSIDNFRKNTNFFFIQKHI